MRRKALWFMLLALPFLIAADEVRQIDGARMHVFVIPGGPSTVFIKTGNIPAAGSTSTTDLDFNDDKRSDWAQVTGIGIRTPAAGASDHLFAYHGQKGGSAGNGWHQTVYPPSAADFFALDLKLVSEISRASSKQDTVLMITNTNVTAANVVYLYVWGG